MTIESLYKDIDDLTSLVASAGHPSEAKAISDAVRFGYTGTEILWSARYCILRLLALTDRLPAEVIAAGRAIVATIDDIETAGNG